MANDYTTISKDGIKYLCGLVRDLASVSEGIDNLNLADDKTFSNIYIKNLIDKCLEDANAEVEKLVGALTHLTCKETAIQPTLDNSEINVIYLYSADGNPPYQQFLKISEDKLVDLGSTSISLEDYIKAADVAKDYATKVELKAVTDKIGTTTLTTTDTTITGAIEEVKGIAEGKVDKTSIVTALGDSVTDDQVTSALLAKTELDKINANLGELSKLKTTEKTNLVGAVNEVANGVGVTKTNPSDKDLNNYKTNGRYTFGNWKEYANAPFETTNGTMLVEDTGAYKTQIAIHRSTGAVKTRLFADNAWSAWQELATMDKIGLIPIEANRTITFSNDYTGISVYRCGYSNIRAHIEIDALCNITSVEGWVQDMGIVLPEGYRPSENMSIPAWCSSDTEAHTPITLMIGANGKLSGYIGQSHTSINRLNITVTYFK